MKVQIVINFIAYQKENLRTQPLLELIKSKAE